MHFLIYIPGKVNQSALADVGLPSLVVDSFHKNLDPGPDGKRGTLFGWRPASGRLYHEYNASQQTWRPCAAWGGMEAGRYWVGMKNGDLPKPDDLQRSFPYRCVKSRLGDGNEWWFPAERELPQNIRLGDDGEWRLVPLKMFDEFCQTCRELRELILLSTGPTRDIFLAELVEFARAGLSVNYRTCPEVESDLGLWDTSLFRATDAEPLILDMIRKAERNE